ncbi:hypothetical protein OS493_012303 [Desmophyllum pertusum]|uniref:Uncharacterized protein n=1 Tax=Desmophyllum pertusum TaxID=174260 RepID=A0A9W9ZQJ2_9CNID|nr:hypothetical protein OS493_012303 [Desmophyllum pertusum]
MNSPEWGLAEMLDAEVSPLLFTDESNENSFEESTHLRDQNSELDSTKNARESRNYDDVSTSLFRGDAEANAVNKGSDGHHKIKDHLSGNQKNEIKEMPVEKNAKTLKRKKSASGSGMKEKGAKTAVGRRKPWQYLVKFIPKSGQRKSAASEEPSCKDQITNKQQRKTDASCLTVEIAQLRRERVVYLQQAKNDHAMFKVTNKQQRKTDTSCLTVEIAKLQ